MPIAFKEWAVTVRALAEGEQLVTLRKGGIREPDKHFALEHERFFLYPTFDHQREDLVRESHQPELRRALEEGVWREGEPPMHALTLDGEIPQPDRVRIRAWAEVAGHWTITDPRAVDALSPFYVWTPDYAEKRLAWKRRHPLHVLLLRTYRIPRPVTVKVRDEYGGCRSWLEITRDLPFEGTPVLSDDEFERASEEIAAIVAGERAGPRCVRAGATVAGLVCVAWLETVTATFLARHERATPTTPRACSTRSSTRARLEGAVPARGRRVTVVLHRSAAQLDAAQPWCPLERRLTAPAARRYVVGWAGAQTLHVLAPRMLASARLERGGLARDAELAPAALLARRVVGPTTAACRRRPAGASAPAAALGVARRGRGAVLLRPGRARAPGDRAPPARGRAPRVPAGLRDAALLGGTVFDLLAREQGPRPRCGSPAASTRRARARAARRSAGARSFTPRAPGARTSRGSPASEGPARARRRRAAVEDSRAACGARARDEHVARAGGEEVRHVEARAAPRMLGMPSSSSNPWISSASAWLRARATLTSGPSAYSG